MNVPEIDSALFACDPSCDRDTWVRLLAGFKAGGGDSETAEGWSQCGASYDPAAFKTTWRSLSSDGGITERTLFRMARDNGWHPSGSLPLPRPRPRSAPVASVKPSTGSYAVSLWRAATDDDKAVAGHPYAQRKKVSSAFGARRGRASGKLLGRDADCLLVPNRTWDGHLIGVECINPDGRKQTFGSKGILILGSPEDRLATIHCCEGWATAYALSQLFPRPFAAIVAFGKSRLQSIAQQAVRRFTGCVVIHIEADNRDVWDLWNEGQADTYVQRLAESV